jgi:hypothetical protein
LVDLEDLEDLEVDLRVPSASGDPEVVAYLVDP